MKRLIYRILVGLSLLSTVSCENEMFEEDLAGFDPNSDLSVYEVQLTGPGQASGEIYWDIGQGNVYTYANAVEKPELIDLVFLWGSSSASNLVAPSDVGRLDGWGTGKTINDEWYVKNETYLIRLEKSEEGSELYNNIKSMSDVESAYSKLKTLVMAQSGYSLVSHGEGTSLRNIDVGDVIGIRTSKDVYAIALVHNIVTGNSGNLRLSLKLDKRNEKEIEPLPESEAIEVSEFTADGLLGLNGANVIDLASGQVLSVQDGYYSQANTDAIIYKNGSEIIISSPSIDLPLISDDALEVNGDWELRHATQFIRLKASTAITFLYNEIFTNSRIRQAFEDGKQIVQGYDDYDQQIYGPGLSVSGLEEEDVVLYYSEARKTYGAIRITAMEENSLSGKIKADNHERIEVAAPVLKEFTSTGAGSTTAAYIDFKTNNVYTSEELGKANAANIDIISVRGSSTSHNLYPLTNGAAIGAWTAAWRTRVETWPIRNAADVYSLGVSPEAWDLYYNLRENETMWDVFQTATASISSTQRLYPITNKEVIFIHSKDRNLLIALKVLDKSTSTSITYRYKIIDL